MAAKTREASQGCRSSRSGSGASAGSGALYGLGVFGAWVYFWQQADGFWAHLYAIFQGIFWPAYMVYEAFSAVAG